MRSHIVLYFGKPGAGKGTRTQKLKERTFLLDDFMILSTGQMLRQAVADGTHLGQEAKAYMDKGELVSDHLIVSVVLDAIEKAAENQKSIILDGFPRNLPQAKALTDALNGKKIYVVDFPIADEIVIERTIHRRICPKCGNVSDDTHKTCNQCGTTLIQRSDDTEEVVKRRLDSYREDTEPVLDYLVKCPNVRLTRLYPTISLEEDPGMETFFRSLH